MRRRSSQISDAPCDALMEAWMQMPDDAWERVGTSLGGPRSQREWVWSRWREVEVHHVDLGLGYAPSEWPVGFVTRGLAEALRELPSRSARSVPSNATVRLEATDHDRVWTVSTGADGAARVEPDSGSTAAVDGTVRGWGCDLLAWLYGRDRSGGGLTATGDLGVLRLPEWFPYP